MPDETSIACARHVESSARIAPCERCGDFLCEACFGPETALTCAACVARTGSDLVPWEREGLSWPRRYLQTTLDVVWSPSLTATRVAKGGSLGPALRYAVSVPLALGFSHAAVFAAIVGTRPMPADLSGTPPTLIVPLLFVTLPIPYALVIAGGSVASLALFWIATRALGARVPAAALARMHAYLCGVYLWIPPLLFVSLVPIVGVLVTLVGHAALLFSPILALQTFGAAQGLGAGRAWAAAIAPLVFPFVFIVGAYWWFASITGIGL